MKMLYLYLDLSNKKYTVSSNRVLNPTYSASFSFANGVYSIPELGDPAVFSEDTLLCVYTKDTWVHDYNLPVGGQYLSSHGLANLGEYAPNPIFLRFIGNGLAFDNTSVFIGGYDQAPLDPNKLLEPLFDLYIEYLSTLNTSSTAEFINALFAKIALDKNSSDSSTGVSSDSSTGVSSDSSTGVSSGSSDGVASVSSFNFRDLDGHLTLIPNGAKVFVSGFSSDHFIVQKSYLVENSVNSFSIYFDLIKDGKVLTIPYTSLAGLVKESNG